MIMIMYVKRCTFEIEMTNLQKLLFIQKVFEEHQMTFEYLFLNSFAHMEDAHTVLLSVPNQPNTAFFGVYDGHGGMYCYHIIITLF